MAMYHALITADGVSKMVVAKHGIERMHTLMTFLLFYQLICVLP
jgi:hypothetical protein